MLLSNYKWNLPINLKFKTHFMFPLLNTFSNLEILIFLVWELDSQLSKMEKYLKYQIMLKYYYYTNFDSTNFLEFHLDYFI